MTGEEMERAIQFLIEHHAKVSTDIKGLKEAQEGTAANIASLAESVSRLGTQAEADRREIRQTFDSFDRGNARRLQQTDTIERSHTRSLRERRTTCHRNQPTSDNP